MFSHLPFLEASTDFGQWCHRMQLHSHMFKTFPHQPYTVFCFVPPDIFYRTVIILMKLEKLDLNTKLLIICLCEDGSSSKSDTGGQYGLTSSMLFTVKYNDWQLSFMYIM